MSYTEKHIVESYSELLESLSASSKRELIESLAKSLTSEEMVKEDTFYSSFGGFASEQSAEDIMKAIKFNRSFRTKDLGF